jgi:hypothetical protein
MGANAGESENRFDGGLDGYYTVLLNIMRSG